MRSKFKLAIGYWLLVISSGSLGFKPAELLSQSDLEKSSIELNQIPNTNY